MGAIFQDRRAAKVTRVFGIAGMAAELASTYAMEKRVAEVPRVGRPLKKGLSGALWKSASALTAAGLITSLLPRQTRKKRIVAGALAGAGSLMLRFAVQQAGVASARDPRAAFHQQRAGHGGSELGRTG